MSYEGYVQCICEKGHYFTSNNIYDMDEKYLCHCGASQRWVNHVDTTNGTSEGVIYVDSLHKMCCVQQAEFGTCNLGHRHVQKEAVFRIPTEAEKRLLRAELYPPQDAFDNLPETRTDK